MTQAMFDAVLGRYADKAYLPSDSMATSVRDATIVEWKGEEFGLELSDDQISERMSIVQLLAFCAVSNRTYDALARYCNSDGVAVFGQKFDSQRPLALSYGTRRRDGGTNHMVSEDHARPLFLRPPHVSDPLIVEFDVSLFISLRKVLDADQMAVIHDAVSLFNRANTDASEVPDSVELVMLRAAYETLLQSGFKAADLKQKLVDHLKEELVEPDWESGSFTKSDWVNRWPGKNEDQTPLEMWVDDFCAARNASAHGINLAKPHQPPIWSIHNHLMFASWLFPLLVKKILETAGLYELDVDERDCRAQLENFFAYDVSERDEHRRLNWHLPVQKLADASLTRSIEKNYMQIKSEQAKS
ncbi:MAG: hypothetical protein Q7K25_03095 [Actinomycetota bacterium]|nr:hypothetical protein [Actinomycetota bacterium]